MERMVDALNTTQYGLTPAETCPPNGRRVKLVESASVKASTFTEVSADKTADKESTPR